MYIGVIVRKEMTRYEFGPSNIEPSIPHVFSAGLTRNIVEEPVMPNTVNKTAASTLDSRQCGRTFVVHRQKAEDIPVILALQ